MNLILLTACSVALLAFAGETGAADQKGAKRRKKARSAQVSGDTSYTQADRQLLSDYGKLVMKSYPIKKMRID